MCFFILINKDLFSLTSIENMALLIIKRKIIIKNLYSYIARVDFKNYEVSVSKKPDLSR